MNEIRKIHISRQAYTIAVDAYGALKEYLDALKAKIDDEDVYKEIELRVVELLSDHGISADKVIIQEDIAYLKENLGELSDFEDDEKTTAEDADLSRRFMRNPRGQMLGGVANGLASYFGVDPIWFRIGFIILTFGSGFGILLYLILWAIMPEAKTSSDFIQMQGKPVTVDSITEFAESKQVEDGIYRIGKFVVDVVGFMLRALLYCIAIGLTTIGVMGILGSVASGIFLLTSSSQLFDGVLVFPVHGIEIAAVVAGMIAGATASLFMLFSGMGIFAKKWQLPTWATASLVTLFFVSLFTAVPLAASSVSRVSQRIDDSYTTHTRRVDAFGTLQITSTDELSVTFEPAEEYSVAAKVFGEKDTALIKTTVENGVLSIDANEFTNKYRCHQLCIYRARPQVTVRGPSFSSLVADGQIYFESSAKPSAQTLEILRRGGATINLENIYPEKITYSKNQDRLVIEGVRDDALESDTIYLSPYGEDLYVARASQVHLVDQEDSGCNSWRSTIRLGSRPDVAFINGVGVSVGRYSDIDEGGYDSGSHRTLSNCIMVDG